MKKAIWLLSLCVVAQLSGASADEILLTIKNNTFVNIGINVTRHYTGAPEIYRHYEIQAGKSKIVQLANKQNLDATLKYIGLTIIFDPPVEIPPLNYHFSGEDIFEVHGKTMNLSIKVGDPAFEKYRPKPMEQKKLAEKR